MYKIQIIKAKLADIDSIKHIADLNKTYLGFVIRGKILQAIQTNCCHVAYHEDNGIVGFVIFYSRKDGWNTIYDIAVHPSFLRQGIGRMLLNSVPSPIQLKCTTDNPANEFYKTCGFKLVETQQGKTRSLNLWKRRYLYIVCQGNFSQLSQLTLYEHGIEYGTRHTEKPFYQPFMVDIDWKKYDWDDYLHKISVWKPTFALVPDYESPSQRKLLYSRIRDLKNLNILRIGVCPKFDGAVAHLPKFCTVCISIPSKYAGFLPAGEEVKGRKLHFLGGSPQKQLIYLPLYSEARTISFDGNAITRNARFKVVYNGVRNKWEPRGTKTPYNLSYVECIQHSLEGIAYQFYESQEYAKKQ